MIVPDVNLLVYAYNMDDSVDLLTGSGTTT